MTEGVRDFFNGKDVLVAGGTGFMGKVLLEKLLRSTNVNKIYVVIRAKRGLGPQSRLIEMFKLPLFDVIRKSNPEKFKKVVAVEGDLSKDNLNLSPALLEELQNNVGVIFNFAASLKLEDTLKTLVVHNTLSALKLLEMALTFKKLKAFVHLSTAFCHCEHEILEEKLYEPPSNPHDVIAAMDWMDETIAQAVTDKLLGPHPNCYTYTKRLAEGLMLEFGKKLPITVVRPSIVIPTFKEPIKGWVDSLNGPIGVLAAGAKGVLRSMLCNPDNTAEVIPVDIAINSVLLAAFKRGITQIGDGDVHVYNVSSGEIEPHSWGTVLAEGKAALREYPLDCGLWYPGGTIRTNPVTHALVVFFAQVIPAYFIDFLFFLFRQKRFMVYVQNRIRLGMKVLQYFTMRQWVFTTSKILKLAETLSKEEQEMFYIANVKVDIKDYMKHAILGARVFCLKEPLENLPRARKQMVMMYYIEKIAQISLAVFVGWLLYNNIAVFRGFLDSVVMTATTYPQQLSK